MGNISVDIKRNNCDDIMGNNDGNVMENNGDTLVNNDVMRIMVIVSPW